jgi:hypothetical protein
MIKRKTATPVVAHTDKKQVRLAASQWGRYRRVRDELERLCIQYGIPVPPVGPAYASDPCDFTSPGMVRLNIPAAEKSMPVDPTLPERAWAMKYAAHIFGHYVCGIEQESGEEESNKIADLIADLLRFGPRDG